jgi:nucleotide-binding universal stress UspA family protein
MSFKHIVVGLDQSFTDSTIFTRALEQAKPHTSSITIVHALKSPPSGLETHLPIGQHTEMAQDLYGILSRQHHARLERSRRQAVNWLDLYLQQAIAKGIPTQIQCPSGNPGLWLCEVAQRSGADLIVIGHRENHGVRSVGNSSVTQYVLQHAACAVLVVQGLPLPTEQPMALQPIDRDTFQPIVTPASGRLASQMFKV